MLERLSWKRLVLELLLCCIPAFILGAMFGYLPWFLLAAVTGLLIWHFWNLLRLSWWLWVGQPDQTFSQRRRVAAGCGGIDHGRGDDLLV